MDRPNNSRITVTVHRGSISFSFETDREGSNLKDMISAIEKLVSSQEGLADIIESPEYRSTLARQPGIAVLSLRLSDLNIPNDVKQRFVDNIKQLSNWDTTLLLLYYAQTGLTNKELRSLSEEFGKPISFTWFDTEFHRRTSEGLVSSRAQPGAKERVYFITELGKKKLEERTTELAIDKKSIGPAKRTEGAGKSLLHERVLELASEGFFKDPKAAGEIRGELRNRGYAYTLGSIGMALLALTRKKELRRILERKGDKTLYLYTMP